MYYVTKHSTLPCGIEIITRNGSGTGLREIGCDGNRERDLDKEEVKCVRAIPASSGALL
jgi:hypothetical protein